MLFQCVSISEILRMLCLKAHHKYFARRSRHEKAWAIPPVMRIPISPSGFLLSQVANLLYCVIIICSKRLKAPFVGPAGHFKKATLDRFGHHVILCLG